jgi:3-methyladenine DNA glycosylase AlkD
LTSSAVASPVTARARQFVAEHLPEARALGRRLGDELDDPETFERDLVRGFRSLADEDYRAAQEWIVPGIGQVIGVRAPFVAAVERELRRPLREASSATAIYLADRLSQAELQEVKHFAHVVLGRALPDESERSWQIVRRLMRRANEWVSVDALANVVAEGILLEPYRWAELEQLVYSPHLWERRLVGSAIATLPFRVPASRRDELRRAPALDLLEALIGDAEADVQKALSWALRSWYRVDPDGVAAFITREADRAAGEDDGHRAWVVRDALTLPAIPAQLASDTRARLQGVRRNAAAPSTSRAYEAARAFAGLPDAHSLAEAPLAR